MDFAKGLFTLTIKEGVSISPTQIRKAVSKRFKVPMVGFGNVSGAIRVKDGKKYFRPKKQKVSYVLENAKGKKILDTLKNGQELRLAGELVISHSMGQKGKKKAPALRLLVSQVIKEKQ